MLEMRRHPLDVLVVVIILVFLVEEILFRLPLTPRHGKTLLELLLGNILVDSKARSANTKG